MERAEGGKLKTGTRELPIWSIGKMTIIVDSVTSEGGNPRGTNILTGEELLDVMEGCLPEVEEVTYEFWGGRMWGIARTGERIEDRTGRGL